MSAWGVALLGMENLVLRSETLKSFNKFRKNIMANSSAICMIACGICWLLVALIVLLLSIGTVEPIEYGIVYNSITKTVNTEHVYKGGWYFIGPIQSFFVFPSTLVNIDFTSIPSVQT